MSGAQRVRAQFPMAGLHREMLLGAKRQHEEALAACLRTVRGETTGELKLDVDPYELLIESARGIGTIDGYLKLDDEARNDV